MQHTFDIRGQSASVYLQYNWQKWYEVFALCRKCHQSTIFLIGNKDPDKAQSFNSFGQIVEYGGSLNEYFDIKRFISVRDHVSHTPPAHLPENIDSAFKEAAACLSIECHNAAACMFRLCVDLATRPLLPDPGDDVSPQPNSKQRRDLGLRLPWLFDNGLLPDTLSELAKCIREDANDGAHVGNLTKVEAEDLLDFTTVLLKRLYTEPENLKLAEARRQARRDD